MELKRVIKTNNWFKFEVKLMYGDADLYQTKSFFVSSEEDLFYLYEFFTEKLIVKYNDIGEEYRKACEDRRNIISDIEDYQSSINQKLSKILLGEVLDEGIGSEDLSYELFPWIEYYGSPEVVESVSISSYIDNVLYNYEEEI